MNQSIPERIIGQIEADLNVRITQTTRISGGCIHHTFRLTLDSNEQVFLKYNHVDAGGNFEIEARGLRQLAQTGALAVPAVKLVGTVEPYAFLLLNWIEQGRQSRDYWTHFGENLARLHQVSKEGFGLEYNNYIGALPQVNNHEETWPEFFIKHRIQPMVDMAAKREYFDRRTLQRFDRLADKIKDVFPAESPALLHGDLWGGNILVGLDGLPVLIDPAIYFGHREMELAFMTLFDKQPPSFYDAYNAVFPLDPDWRNRIDICNLYPLLVHVNLFGGGYIQSVERILFRFT